MLGDRLDVDGIGDDVYAYAAAREPLGQHKRDALDAAVRERSTTRIVQEKDIAGLHLDKIFTKIANI